MRAIVAIGADQSLTVVDATGKTIDTMPNAASPDLLHRFWGGFTKARFDSIIGGALQDWIVANAAGAPVLLVVGLVLGPLDLAFLTGVLAKAGDLFALVISKVAESEVNDGTISSDELAIIKGAVGVVDLITQLPAILTDESKVSQIASSISAANGLVSSFTSENSAVQLTVTLQAGSVGKYVLALKALTTQ